MLRGEKVQTFREIEVEKPKYICNCESLDLFLF